VKRKTLATTGAVVLAVLVLAIAYPAFRQSGRATGERGAWGDLKTIALAQADYRSNDRDGNGEQDFWRSDVAGLYSMRNKEGEEIRLIGLSTACADDRPLRPAGPRAPKAGFWFRAIPHEGETKPDPRRFAACCFPADYPRSGRLTFIIDEGNTIYRRDLGHGRGLEAFPADLQKDGWTKLD
jgi:hypothetical protein